MIQSFKDIFRRETDREQHKGLLAIEKLCLLYALVTLVFIVFLWGRMDHPLEMVSDRFQIGLMTLALWLLYKVYPCRFMRFVRITSQMAMLNFWYPDTYEFNRLFNNLDYLFARWEQDLFACQPAILFGQYCNSALFSEPFNLGYFSYYPMIVVVAFFYFLCRYPRYEEATFIIMCSFFIYYLVYIFLPVAGPQYYFQAVGLDKIMAGEFPELGTYFNSHTEMMQAPGYADGFFYKMIESTQAMGERPTAAFPSSHIGISTILLILSFRTSKTLGWMLFPFFILLCCATVYIQAHYLIDAIAGLLSAVVIYFFSRTIYYRFFVKY